MVPVFCTKYRVLSSEYMMLFMISVQDNPYNGTDNIYRIIIFTLPVLLQKTVTLVEWINMY